MQVFFSFFPFHLNLSAATSLSLLPPPRLALTQAISRQHHLDTATTAPTLWLLQLPPRHPCGEPSTHWNRPHKCRGHTQATPPLPPSLCLVHLKKASDKSFPFFPPSSLMVQDTSPQHRPIAPPCGTQAPTPPPFTRMQATLSLLPSPQPPPPQCFYNWRHFPDPGALQPASPNFATQTGGAKGALAPTISMTPPFTHPPPLCRSSHPHGCPHCTPQFMCPAPSCLPSSPAFWGVQGGQRAPSPLCPGYAAGKGKGRAQGEGEGPGGMCARRRAAYKGRGRVCEQASKWGCA